MQPAEAGRRLRLRRGSRRLFRPGHAGSARLPPTAATFARATGQALRAIFRVRSGKTPKNSAACSGICVIVSSGPLVYICIMSLREQVERLLPTWERWYPSLFDAASDLGLIKAQVCDPGSLLLSTRHARIRQRAEDAHREKWGGKE